MKNPIFIWIVKLLAVVILLQTLYFKFTGAEESVYIFSTLGIEPYGRIGSGIIELIACILILIPRTTLFGALIGFFTMLGAIISHIFFIGIDVKKDGGILFILAVITLICCAINIYIDKERLIKIISSNLSKSFVINNKIK